MLLYVAGPYRGDVRRNIARAGLISARLWELGHTVICPHLNTAHFELLTTVSNDQYVERDLEIVRRVDGLVMVPGWRMSSGARAEYRAACGIGLPAFEWPDVPSKAGALLRGAYSRHEVEALSILAFNPEAFAKVIGPDAPKVRLYMALRREGLLDGLLTTPRP